MKNENISYKDEVQLLGYGESDSYGPWIKLRLLDPESLAVFRGEDTGKKTGKRYACVLVEIGDDEKPVKVKRHLSQEAAMVTKSQNWAKFTMFRINSMSKKENMAFRNGLREAGDPDDVGDEYLKHSLAINSKRELDTADEQLIYEYRRLMKDYSQFCRERGL